MAQIRLPPNAGTLFAPSEMPEYRLWLKVSGKPKVRGVTVVPTAFEYADYQQWRKEEHARKAPPDHFLTPGLPELEEDKPSFALAEKCKHALHPAHHDITSQDASADEEQEVKEGSKWCPTCTLQHHNTLINILYTNWTDVGGPWRDGPLVDKVDRMAYSETNRAYHTARVALVNTISMFEDMACEEENWNLAHPEQDVNLPMAHSATAALEQYRKALTFPARLREVQPPQTPTSKRLHDKKLEYSPDTPEDTRHRPQKLWARYLSSHDPESPHACASPEGYQDTSYYHNWHFAISQCRILFCYYIDKEEVLLRYRDLNKGAGRGPENPHVLRLIKIIHRHVSKETRETQMQWQLYLKDTSDIFLVWNKATMMDEENSVFTHFEHIVSLVGSSVQDYARMIGEIDDEEWAAREEESVDGEEEQIEDDQDGEQGEEEAEEEDGEGEHDDFYDQMSVAPDSDADNEIVKTELADTMDVEGEDEQ